MYKKTISLLMIALLIISLSSCSDLGIGDALALDEDLHIRFKYLEDNRIEYQETIYYLSPMSFLWGEEEILDTLGDYKYIGWTGARFFYKSHIFGDSMEAPTFLYSTNTRETYLKEDYDYQTDDFLVNGTDAIIRFCDDLLETDYENSAIYSQKSTEVIISSVNHPTLKAQLFIVIDDEEWYAVSRSLTAFKLSEHFIDILINNEIIPNP